MGVLAFDAPYLKFHDLSQQRNLMTLASYVCGSTPLLLEKYDLPVTRDQYNRAYCVQDKKAKIPQPVYEAAVAELESFCDTLEMTKKAAQDCLRGMDEDGNQITKTTGTGITRHALVQPIKDFLYPVMHIPEGHEFIAAVEKKCEFSHQFWLTWTNYYYKLKTIPEETLEYCFERADAFLTNAKDLLARVKDPASYTEVHLTRAKRQEQVLVKDDADFSHSLDNAEIRLDQLDAYQSIVIHQDFIDLIRIAAGRTPPTNGIEGRTLKALAEITGISYGKLNNYASQSSRTIKAEDLKKALAYFDGFGLAYDLPVMLSDPRNTLIADPPLVDFVKKTINAVGPNEMKKTYARLQTIRTAAYVGHYLRTDIEAMIGFAKDVLKASEASGTSLEHEVRRRKREVGKTYYSKLRKRYQLIGMDAKAQHHAIDIGREFKQFKDIFTLKILAENFTYEEVRTINAVYHAKGGTVPEHARAAQVETDEMQRVLEKMSALGIADQDALGQWAFDKKKMVQLARADGDRIGWELIGKHMHATGAEKKDIIDTYQNFFHKDITELEKQFELIGFAPALYQRFGDAKTRFPEYSDPFAFKMLGPHVTNDQLGLVTFVSSHPGLTVTEYMALIKPESLEETERTYRDIKQIMFKLNQIGLAQYEKTDRGMGTNGLAWTFDSESFQQKAKRDREATRQLLEKNYQSNQEWEKKHPDPQNHARVVLIAETLKSIFNQDVHAEDTKDSGPAGADVRPPEAREE